MHQVAKVLKLQLQHQSFQCIFRTDFLQDRLVGSPCAPRDSQGSSPTPQYKSIHSSALNFFMVQLSHPYMTVGKTITLTLQTSVGKVMSLLFNILSRLVTAFFPRSKCLLTSWLQSPSAVILAKWLSEEALQIAKKRSEAKCKEKGKDILNWMQSSRE